MGGQSWLAAHWGSMTSPESAPHTRLCLPIPLEARLGLGFSTRQKKELCSWYKIKEVGDIFNTNQKYPIITEPVFSRSKKKKNRFCDFLKAHILTIFSEATFMSSKEMNFLSHFITWLGSFGVGGRRSVANHSHRSHWDLNWTNYQNRCGPLLHSGFHTPVLPSPKAP